MNSSPLSTTLPVEPQYTDSSKPKKKIYLIFGIILIILTISISIGYYFSKFPNSSQTSSSDNLIDYSIPIEEDSRIVELPENTIRISKHASSSAKPNPGKY